MEDLLAITTKAVSKTVSKEMVRVIDKAIKEAISQAIKLLQTAESDRPPSSSTLDNGTLIRTRKAGPILGRRWSGEDVQRLAKLKRRGLTNVQIGKKLERSASTVA